MKHYWHYLLLACLGWILTACDEDPAILQPAVGGLSPAGTAGDEYFNAFSHRLAEISNGTMAAKLLTRGEIGSDEQVFSALRRGRVQIALNGTYSIAAALPEFAVLGMPFLFDSEPEIDFVVDRYITPAVEAPLSQAGLELLALMPMGWINFYGIRAVSTPMDLQGMRLRQPNDLASQIYARQLGNDVVPLPTNEVVPALQTGLIDAGTTVTLNYLWSGVATHAPHLALTQHAFLFNALMVNATWWHELTELQQDFIRKAFPPPMFFVDRMRRAECTDIAKATAEGVEVDRLAKAQRQQWRSVAANARPAILEALGPRAQRLYAAIQAGKTAFADQGGDQSPLRGVARCGALEPTGTIVPESKG